MKIKDFEANDNKRKKELEEKLKNKKIENVLSLWYLVRSKSRSTIAGSKDWFKTNLILHCYILFF